MLLSSCVSGVDAPAAVPDTQPAPAAEALPVTTTSMPAPTTTTTPPPPEPPNSVGRPWGVVPGLTMFRGNPTRTFYGTGPRLEAPTLDWRFPQTPMCGVSSVGGEDKVWCGSGWTGQPVVWKRSDGVTEVIFGAYDKAIHFLDAATGERTRPDFPMGDIVKGSVTLDPDGFPLLYSGSRDPRFRIIALDQPEPRLLWSLESSSVDGMWNNDWDSNAVIVDDVMYVGGENSWFFAIKLNRGYADDGGVTVAPEVVFSMPAWTPELLSAVGRQQSIESSIAVYEDRAYFTTSAGRVVGLDTSRIVEGEAPVVFDFWAGDDIDATPVLDGDGMLYVGVEIDLATRRGGEVGQLVKLDPSLPEDPVVWSLAVPSANGVAGGIWATPALHGDVLYAATNPGDLLAVDTATGEVLWRDDVGVSAWSSPVIVADTLILAVSCFESPAIRAYDVSAPEAPQRLWEIPHQGGGCIESTPAVWDGRLYVGARDGYFYAYDG